MILSNTAKQCIKRFPQKVKYRFCASRTIHSVSGTQFGLRYSL